MTVYKLSLFVLVLPLAFTSLACPTRLKDIPDASDEGRGGKAGRATDGGNGGSAAAGATGPGGAAGHANGGTEMSANPGAGAAGASGSSGGASGASGAGGMAAGHGMGGGINGAAGASVPSGGASGTGGMAAGQGTGGRANGAAGGGGTTGIAGMTGGGGARGGAGGAGGVGTTGGSGGVAASCVPACTPPTGGTSTCVNGSCVAACNLAGHVICGTACVDKTSTATDANNCGSCGHSCAGGTCSAGVCQALSLGTIPSGSPQNLVLSGGFLYVITADLSTPPSVWQLNPNAASTPISIASSIPSPTSPRCVMDGKLFWVAPSTGSNMPSPIMWCSITNCAATTATLLTSPGQAENPVCDTTADELVWDDFTTPYAGATDSVVTIYRVATNGTNRRTMTSFYELGGANEYVAPGFVNGRADRFFFAQQTFTPLTETLFYVLTNSAGAGPVSIASGTSGQNGINLGEKGFANDRLFVWPDDSGFSQIDYELPLPNGVTGTPPVFYQGYTVDGIMDDQNFYGAFTTLPGDAVGICPVSNCTSPAILFRGQQSASGFTQDSTAIYWTTLPATGSGFTVWKGAK